MGCGHECGDGLWGAVVTRWPGRSQPAGGGVFRHPGDGSLPCLQWVSGAVASGVLGTAVTRL